MILLAKGYENLSQMSNESESALRWQSLKNNGTFDFFSTQTIACWISLVKLGVTGQMVRLEDSTLLLVSKACRFTKSMFNRLCIPGTFIWIYDISHWQRLDCVPRADWVTVQHFRTLLFYGKIKFGEILRIFCAMRVSVIHIFVTTAHDILWFSATSKIKK